MTDTTDNVGGHYKHHGPIITCILDEGAPTVTASGSVFDDGNTTARSLTWASQLARGNMVALSEDTGCTWLLTGGIPVMELAVTTKSLTIGQIVSAPKLVKFPATTGVADSLAKRLAAGYFRTVLVELYAGITKVLKAEVTLDGTNGWEVGQTAALHHNITSDYADDDTIEIKLISAADTGTGIIALHYGADGETGDQLNCLVGINGVLYSVTGA